MFDTVLLQRWWVFSSTSTNSSLSKGRKTKPEFRQGTQSWIWLQKIGLPLLFLPAWRHLRLNQRRPQQGPPTPSKGWGVWHPNSEGHFPHTVAPPRSSPCTDHSRWGNFEAQCNIEPLRELKGHSFYHQADGIHPVKVARVQTKDFCKHMVSLTQCLHVKGKVLSCPMLDLAGCSSFPVGLPQKKATHKGGGCQVRVFRFYQSYTSSSSSVLRNTFQRKARQCQNECQIEMQNRKSE